MSELQLNLHELWSKSLHLFLSFTPRDRFLSFVYSHVVNSDFHLVALRNSCGVDIKWVTMWLLPFQDFQCPSRAPGSGHITETAGSPYTAQVDSSQQLWLEPSDAHPAAGSWKEWSCQQKRPRIEAQKGHACWHKSAPKAPVLGFRGAGWIMWGKQEPSPPQWQFSRTWGQTQEAADSRLRASNLDSPAESRALIANVSSSTGTVL